MKMHIPVLLELVSRELILPHRLGQQRAEAETTTPLYAVSPPLLF